MSNTVRLMLSAAVSAAAMLLGAASASAVTWTAVNSGTSNEITGIEYQSESRFWFATSGGEIFKRQGDGSFKRTLSAPVSFSQIAFQPSGDIGIAITPSAEVYRSDNGGESWAPVTGLQASNNDCTANEAVTTAFTVRWAGNEAVYIFAGGNKVVRSAGPGAIGATGTWTNANPVLSSGTCRAEFASIGGGPGVTDGFFTPGAPNRGWMIGANFGEMYFAQDVTQNNSYQKKPAAATNGFETAKRLVADPGNVNRQWAIALDEGGNTSYIGRTTDGWGSEADWSFADQTRPARTSNHDIAVGGGTVINVGQSGMIEMSPDGQTFFYTPAGGENATRDWRAVDVADASHAAVGGVGGTLIVSSDANAAPDLVKPVGTIVVPPKVNAGVPATFSLQANEPINPASVSWRAGSLPAQVGQAVNYIFPSEGFFTLTATFSDLAGNVGEARASITVTKPDVDFTPPGAKSPIPTPQSETRKGKRYTVLNIRGTLGIPPRIAKAVGCKGTITATVTNRRRLVTARKIKVSSKSCKYRKKVRFLRSKVRGRKITVTLEWPGNTVMSRTTYKKTFNLKR